MNKFFKILISIFFSFIFTYTLGFSSKEKEFIYDNKFLKVSVAKAVLRSETAVVSILSILNELMVQYE